MKIHGYNIAETSARRQAVSAPFIPADFRHPSAIGTGGVHSCTSGCLRADVGGVVEGEVLAASRRVLAAGFALAYVLHYEHVHYRALALAWLGTIRTSCVWRAFFRSGQAISTIGGDLLTVAGHCANHVALGICHVLAVGRVLTHADAVAETSGYIDGDDVALACSLLVAVATALWWRSCSGCAGRTYAWSVDTGRA